MLLLLSPSNPRERRRARRDLARALAAVPLALLTQAALVAFVWWATPARPPKSPRAASQPVSLRTISSAHWASNRGAAVRAVERPAPLHPKGQVVDVAPGNEQVPAESKYLAETDNRVEKQTRAREQTQVWSRATAKNQPNPAALPSAKGRAAPPVEVAAAPNFLASALGRRQWSLLGERATPGVADAPPREEPPAPVGTAQGTQASGGDASEGGGAPNDALNDVPAGDGTFLNTREWRYAAFFNRVKQAVSAKWDPNGRLRAKNRTPGWADRVTVLNVTLRPDGSVADVYVARGSGVDELDQEAVKAFEQAQPFTNPPAALVEQGFIRFTFGFTLTAVESGPGALPRFMRMGP